MKQITGALLLLAAPLYIASIAGMRNQVYDLIALFAATLHLLMGFYFLFFAKDKRE